MLSSMKRTKSAAISRLKLELSRFLQCTMGEPRVLLGVVGTISLQIIFLRAVTTSALDVVLVILVAEKCAALVVPSVSNRVMSKLPI